MKKFLRLLPYIVILILISFLWVKNQRENILERALTASQTETTFFKNKLGTITASREVIEVANSDLKKIISQQNEDFKKLAKEFKKVKSAVIIKTEVVFDTIEAPFINQIPFTFIRTGNVNEKWYSLEYKVTEKGLTISPFKTWTDLTVITGEKRKWFLGKKTYVTDVTASNPFISVLEVKSFTAKKKVRWYDTTVFKVGIGVIGGVLIAK